MTDPTFPRRNRDRSGLHGELADPAAAERFETEHRDAYLRRRDFLQRTAMLAGAAGLASVLPLETLVSEAAKKQVLTALPAPRDVPIDTFVVLMMENRSFDHYLGWHPDADAKNAGLSYPTPDGSRVETYHLPPDYQGCSHPDPAHGWSSGRFQYGGGRLDGFVFGNEEGTGSDEFAAGYYLKEDVGFLPHVADAYTLYDRWFCSIMGSTYPNRHYQVAAQNGGQKSNEFPIPPKLDEGIGFQWETIFDRARSKGVSVGYYVSDLPFPALYGDRGLTWVRPVAQFYLDAATGNLPQICFVDPPFLDGGGGHGVSADEHPHGDIRLGQAFMSDITHAFIESPQYARGAMFINYDEWGGFFDHVRPPHVPDDRADRKDLENDWSFCGFRVPAVCISPFSRGGNVNHMTLTHESILKLISYRFGLGHLNTRHRYASNAGYSLDFANPDPEPPELPDPAAIVAVPCELGGNPQPAGFPGVASGKWDGAPIARPEPHHLEALESTGLLDRLGYEVQRPTYTSIYRNPDSVRKALAASQPGG